MVFSGGRRGRLLVFSVGRRGYLFSSPALSMRLLVFSGGRRDYLFLKFTSFDEALGLLSWEEGLGSWSSQAGGGARLLVFSVGRRG